MSVMIMPSANNALSGHSIYGSGTDGAVVFNGVNTFAFATLSGSTYTLLRNIYPTTCSILNGIIVISSNYIIFCSVSFTNAGTFHCNGGNASGATAGAITGASAGGFLGSGVTGASGIASGGAAASGSNGGSANPAAWFGGRGGRGAGAWVTANTNLGGGSSGSMNSALPTIISGGLINMNYILTPLLGRNIVANSTMSFGAGGGGGGKSATGTSCNSGGGGAGGGSIAIFSPIITNTGTISVNGGNGGNAAGTDASAGGGGGGGGGNIWLVYDYYSNSGTVSATGGTGGTSIALGSTPLRAIARTCSFANVATNTTLSYLPATIPVGVPQVNNLYLLSIGLKGTVQDPTISGWGLTWTKITSVDFNTAGTPTQRLLLYYAYGTPVINDITKTISIVCATSQTAIVAVVDQIDNVPGTIIQSKTATTDGATTLSVTLDGAIANSDSAVYGVIATNSTAVKTAGSGFVKITENVVQFAQSSELSYNDTGIDFSWTGSTAAGIIGIELGLLAAMEDGKAGQAGNIIQIPNKV